MHRIAEGIKHCAKCKRELRKNEMVMQEGDKFFCLYCFKNAKDAFQDDIEKLLSDDVDETEEECFFEEYLTFPKIKNIKKYPTPQEIVDYLDRFVIGQEQAKKSLAVAAYNHFRRINCKDEGTCIPKSNILLQGPTGSGKTFLLKNLAKLLDVPISIADASLITEAAYKGKDVESVLTGLYEAAGQDIKKAERGICVLDEFDKLNGHSTDGTPSVGEGVQRQILKAIEGCEMAIPATGVKMTSNTVNINTENILFICMGAFVGIGEGERKHRPIGYLAKDVDVEPIHNKKKLTTQHFIDYGLIPELVGRLPVIVELNGLSEEDLTKILLDSESSFLKSYQAMLKEDRVELIFDDNAIKEIAHIAYEKGTGARGLNAIIEGLMEDLLFKIPSNPRITKCVITKAAVQGLEKPLIEEDEELDIVR